MNIGRRQIRSQVPNKEAKPNLKEVKGMLGKRKISAFQMAFMLYPTILGTGFLALPTITAKYAQNDLWLTGIFASVTGFLTVYIITRLHSLYPGQTFIQYIEHIVGKFLGKTIGFVYFLYIVFFAGSLTRHYAEFVVGSFLFKTPMLLITTSMVLLTATAVRGGLEVIARISIIFMPLFFLSCFFSLSWTSKTYFRF